MAYRCGQAITGRADEPIRCKVSGTVCAHQKFCQMEGRIVLTDGALRCPARDGQMPEETQVVQETVKTEPAKKPAKKAIAKKTAARKK